MEEKVLVKSEQYNLKRLFAIICVIGLIIGLIVSIAVFGSEFQESNEMVAEYQYKVDCFENTNRMWFEVYSDSLDTWKDSRAHDLKCIFSTTIACTLIPVIVYGIIYYAWSRIELVVSDKRVYGKAVFGKRVDLPLDSVSAIGSTWPKGIAVSTASGKIAFLMIKNCEEIHKCLSELLIDRQGKAPVVPVTTIKQEIPQSNAEEIKKYKELLDMGVITQEEFDAKKQQLLEL